MSKFSEYIETHVQPWLKDHLISGSTIAKDGTTLQYYYALQQNPKGAVTFAHGYCEFLGKYHEMLCRFYEEGYSVFFMEMRGHGYSGGRVGAYDAVYVKSFDDYVSDLEIFQKTIVAPMTKGLPHILFGHSMGGAISCLYLLKNPDDFVTAVLASPLIGINHKKTKRWKIHMMGLYSLIKKNDIELVPGTKGWTSDHPFETSSASSRERYFYQFNQRIADEHYQCVGTTVGWVKAAVKATRKIQREGSKIKIPLLLCQATRDTMVDNHAQDVFEQNSPNTTIIVFNKPKHEIYNGDDDTVERFYEMVFNYLNKQTHHNTNQEDKNTNPHK